MDNGLLLILMADLFSWYDISIFPSRTQNDMSVGPEMHDFLQLTTPPPYHPLLPHQPTPRSLSHPSPEMLKIIVRCRLLYSDISIICFWKSSLEETTLKMIPTELWVFFFFDLKQMSLGQNSSWIRKQRWGERTKKKTNVHLCESGLYNYVI